VFAVVFALFVVAMVVLVIVIMRWAITHDIDERRRLRDEMSQSDGEVSG